MSTTSFSTPESMSSVEALRWIDTTRVLEQLMRILKWIGPDNTYIWQEVKTLLLNNWINVDEKLDLATVKKILKTFFASLHEDFSEDDFDMPDTEISRIFLNKEVRKIGKTISKWKDKISSVFLKMWKIVPWSLKKAFWKNKEPFKEAVKTYKKKNLDAMIKAFLKKWIEKIWITPTSDTEKWLLSIAYSNRWFYLLEALKGVSNLKDILTQQGIENMVRFVNTFWNGGDYIKKISTNNSFKDIVSDYKVFSFYGKLMELAEWTDIPKKMKKLLPKDVNVDVIKTTLEAVLDSRYFLLFLNNEKIRNTIFALFVDDEVNKDNLKDLLNSDKIDENVAKNIFTNKDILLKEFINSSEYANILSTMWDSTIFDKYLEYGQILKNMEDFVKEEKWKQLLKKFKNTEIFVEFLNIDDIDYLKTIYADKEVRDITEEDLKSFVLLKNSVIPIDLFIWDNKLENLKLEDLDKNEDIKNNLEKIFKVFESNKNDLVSFLKDIDNDKLKLRLKNNDFVNNFISFIQIVGTDIEKTTDSSKSIIKVLEKASISTTTWTTTTEISKFALVLNNLKLFKKGLLYLKSKDKFDFIKDYADKKVFLSILQNKKYLEKVIKIMDINPVALWKIMDKDIFIQLLDSKKKLLWQEPLKGYIELISKPYWELLIDKISLSPYFINMLWSKKIVKNFDDFTKISNYEIALFAMRNNKAICDILKDKSYFKNIESLWDKFSAIAISLYLPKILKCTKCINTIKAVDEKLLLALSWREDFLKILKKWPNEVVDKYNRYYNKSLKPVTLP